MNAVHASSQNDLKTGSASWSCRTDVSTHSPWPADAAVNKLLSWHRDVSRAMCTATTTAGGQTTILKTPALTTGAVTHSRHGAQVMELVNQALTLQALHLRIQVCLLHGVFS